MPSKQPEHPLAASADDADDTPSAPPSTPTPGDDNDNETVVVAGVEEEKPQRTLWQSPLPAVFKGVPEEAGEVSYGDWATPDWATPRRVAFCVGDDDAATTAAWEW
jgi:hypothetical protein